MHRRDMRSGKAWGMESDVEGGREMAEESLFLSGSPFYGAARCLLGFCTQHNFYGLFASFHLIALVIFS